MAAPRLLARLEVTNAQGQWDSRNPSPRPGDGRDSVRIAWSVRKTLDQEPNEAEIKVWNLAPETVDKICGTVRRRFDWTPEERAQLYAAGASAAPVERTYDNAGLASVRLSWGYEGASPTSSFPPLSVGFVGESTNISEEKDGTDTLLVFTCKDASQLLGAGRPVLGAPAPVSFVSGTPFDVVLSTLIKFMGLTVNQESLKSTIQSAMIARDIPLSEFNIVGPYNATTATAAQQLTTALDALELRWSVQDGEFLVLDRFDTLAGYEALVLTGDALHGPPKRLAAQQMQATTWANAEARPGREVRLTADALGAQFRIDSVEQDGDTSEGGSAVVTLSEIQVIPGLF